MAQGNKELRDAGFKANGHCYTCGKEVGAGSHYCPGDDSRLISTLLTNPATAAAMHKVLRIHLGDLPATA